MRNWLKERICRYKLRQILLPDNWVEQFGDGSVVIEDAAQCLERFNSWEDALKDYDNARITGSGKYYTDHGKEDR